MLKSPVLLTFLFLTFCSSIFSQNAKNVSNSAQESSGFSALQTHFHQLVDDEKLAGTVMLVAQGKETWIDTYGMQDLERQKPMQTNTIFRMASMTKPIVSVAAMLLYEEGKLPLEASVSDYLPAFKQVKVWQEDGQLVAPNRTMTIEDLLLHTSGISSSGFDSSPVGTAYREAFQSAPQTLEDLVTTVASLPLRHHPGENWTYGHSTDVLGLIIEKVAGEPLEDFLQRRIFDPLKMVDTGFKVPKEKASRFATFYNAAKDGSLIAIDTPLKSKYVNGHKHARGNTGLTSTVDDYYRFAKMLLQKGILDDVRILKEETVKLMFQNHLPDNLIPIKVGEMPVLGYGFGLGAGVIVHDTPFGAMPGTFTWMGAAFTSFFIDPEHDLIGIFMSQYADLSKMAWLYEFHGITNEQFGRGAK